MKRPADHTAAWKWTGLAVAVFIVLSLPLYYFLGAERAGPAAVPSADARFVGSAECRDCHNPEFDAWEGSHHDLAMDVATEDTVLKDHRLFLNGTDFSTPHPNLSKMIRDLNFDMEIVLETFYIYYISK